MEFFKGPIKCIKTVLLIKFVGTKLSENQNRVIRNYIYELIIIQ